MFRRFASASAVACVAIACAVSGTLLWQGTMAHRFFPVLVLWSFAPLAWGIWAVLAPASWIPKRLPAWGAILGLAAGSLAIFGLDLPALLFQLSPSSVVRGAIVLMIVVFYYLLWVLVRLAYRALGPATIA